MIRLQVKFNGRVIQELESEQDEIAIGRNADNDLQIDNVTVSGRHARIIKEKNKYLVEDLDSTNGTYVNEKKVGRRVLRERDLITLGKHSIAVSFASFGVQARGQAIDEIEKTFKLEPGQQRQVFKKQL